ncbi:MAG TPA: hypothetical protein VGQ93_02400 [Lysobacter sp.]|jgi:hypothetical protein|nr:hypothetical protein [Lysobacter sp.]
MYSYSLRVNAYPIWWLSSLALSGNLQDDIRDGRIIPLRDLISGTGPEISQHVNLYYIEYWSLSHFLFHYEGGRYANAYKSLMARGGSLENFESLVGPTEQLQREWYAYLMQKASEVDAPESHRGEQWTEVTSPAI